MVAFDFYGPSIEEKYGRIMVELRCYDGILPIWMAQSEQASSAFAFQVPPHSPQRGRPDIKPFIKRYIIRE
jgi:hypothetical protein